MPLNTLEFGYKRNQTFACYTYATIHRRYEKLLCARRFVEKAAVPSTSNRQAQSRAPGHPIWIITKIPTSRAPARRDRDVESTLHPPRADSESKEAICVLSLCTLLLGFCTTGAVRRVYAFLSSSCQGPKFKGHSCLLTES